MVVGDPSTRGFPFFGGSPLCAAGEGFSCSAVTRTDSSMTASTIHHVQGPSSQIGRGVGGSNRMASFVDGIISPFVSCWQPPIESCSIGLHQQHQQQQQARQRSRPPAVVSPYTDRRGPTSSAPSPVQLPYPPSHSTHLQQSHSQPQASVNIHAPHHNDVLCGRGGSSNRHVGNLNFRELVACNKKTYSGLTKKQKMMVARQIVETVHTTDPPGRFLAKDPQSGRWFDIGLPRSLEKTSQALREKMSNENRSVLDDGSSTTDATTSTVTAQSSNSKSTKSSRNVEMPTIYVPPHLEHVYRRKKPHVPAPSPVSPSGPPPPPLVDNRIPVWSEYQQQTQAQATYFNPHYHREDRHNTSSPPAMNLDYHHPYTNRHTFTNAHSMYHPPSTSYPRQEPPLHTGLPSPRSTKSVSSPTLIPEQSTSMIIDSPKNTSVRHEISPARRQEWKRQRTSEVSMLMLSESSSDMNHANNSSTKKDNSSSSDVNHTNNNTTKKDNSSSSLSSALEKRLSLREEELARRREIASPSSLLQTRSVRTSRSQDGGDGLSGLAALSTAAFLRLDES